MASHSINNLRVTLIVSFIYWPRMPLGEIAQRHRDLIYAVGSWYGAVAPREPTVRLGIRDGSLSPLSFRGCVATNLVVHLESCIRFRNCHQISAMVVHVSTATPIGFSCATAPMISPVISSSCSVIIAGLNYFY